MTRTKFSFKTKAHGLHTLDAVLQKMQGAKKHIDHQMITIRETIESNFCLVITSLKNTELEV